MALRPSRRGAEGVGRRIGPSVMRKSTSWSRHRQCSAATDVEKPLVREISAKLTEYPSRDNLDKAPRRLKCRRGKMQYSGSLMVSRHGGELLPRTTRSSSRAPGSEPSKWQGLGLDSPDSLSVIDFVDFISDSLFRRAKHAVSGLPCRISIHRLPSRTSQIGNPARGA